MSVFRPSARVVDPAGREWEIYAYRIKLPERGTHDPGLDGQVLAQVEGGLARGDTPRPRNAQFRGVEGY